MSRDKQRKTSISTVPYSEETRLKTLLGWGLFGITQLAGRAYYRLRLLNRRRRGKPAAIQRILVERYGTLGDTVVVLPALEALRQRFPNARIVLGVQPGYAAHDLLRETEWVDETRVLDHLLPPLKISKTLRGAIALFLEGFDLVLCGTSSALKHEGLMAGIPFRWGLYDHYPLQALNGFLVPLNPTRHEADNYLALVESLDQLSDRPSPVSGTVSPAPRLVLDEQAVRQGQQQLLERLGIPAGAPLVTIHPGSKKPSRRWPSADYTELARRLLARRADLWIALTGSNGEREVVDSIYSALPAELQQRTVSVVGKTDLNALVGLLDRTQVLVCNDTGVMHLGRARGTPLVALLGPENHARWGPHPLGSGAAIALRYVVPCAPCQRWDCDYLYCLKLLGVDEAEKQVMGLLAETPEKATRQPGTARYHLQTRSWADLARAGFTVPPVSVVSWHPLPAPNFPGQDAIAKLGQCLQQQDYPCIELVWIGDRAIAQAEPQVVIVSPATDPVTTWQKTLSQVRGEFIVPVPWGELWRLDSLSEAIATLVRDPGSAGIITGYIPPLYDRRPHPPHSLLAIRKQSLAALLATQPPRRKRRSSLWEPLTALSPVVEIGYQGRLLASGQGL